jgi:hypothetical protein
MSKTVSRVSRGALLLLGVAAFTQVAHAQSAGPKDRTRQGNAAPLSESYPEEAVGDGVTTRGYNQSRWAEDWSALRDPAKRDDPLDALKFVPIDENGDSYLTFSGELRARMNHTTNPNLREAESQRQDILRAVGGVDLHVGKHFRAYGELAHASLNGENLGTPGANLQNDLTIQQAFVDVMAEVEGVDLGVRYGRQTFADGPNLMVVPRDNNTIFFTYNGVRAWARSKSFRVDVFDYRPTRYGFEGLSDDVDESTQRFSGVSTGIVLPKSLFGDSQLYLDPFVWRLRDDEAAWGGVTAREVRNYYGVHFWGDVGPLEIDWTVNHQNGRFDNRDVSAWQVFAAQTYRLGEGRSAPRVGIHADFATGGGSYDGGTLRTALAPFGNNIYYSYQLYATPTNFIGVAPNFSFQPIPKVRTTLEYQASWRQTSSDAVYRANGSAFAGTQNVADRKIADTLRAQLVWTINPRLSFTGRYEHLIAGPSLKQAGYRSSDFVAGWLSFRF